jgi:hypothetical protein
MLVMQTLGISDSTARTEGRLKSLFWPSIENGADVDYLAVQGYWVCTIVGGLSLALLLVGRQPLLGISIFLFFHLGGVGVRERSRFAATVMFIFYVLDTVASLTILLASPGMIVLRAIITALLLSNLRASWIAARWQLGSDEAAMPMRLYETWSDRFANRWPMWLWPKIRVVYYVLSIGLLLMFVAGLAVMVSSGARRG